jgi:hypothetical protein
MYSLDESRHGKAGKSCGVRKVHDDGVGGDHDLRSRVGQLVSARSGALEPGDGDRIPAATADSRSGDGYLRAAVVYLRRRRRMRARAVTGGEAAIGGCPAPAVEPTRLWSPVLPSIEA